MSLDRLPFRAKKRAALCRPFYPDSQARIPSQKVASRAAEHVWPKFVTFHAPSGRSFNGDSSAWRASAPAAYRLHRDPEGPCKLSRPAHHLKRPFERYVSFFCHRRGNKVRQQLRYVNRQCLSMSAPILLSEKN